ncbi:MAG: hypothetical protein SNH73_03915 [Rikenellaceae bacterium]
MNTKRVITALLTLCGVATVTLATAQRPTVEARIEQDSVGIGDRFTYSIIVDRDMVQVVEFPEFEFNESDPIELVEILPIDTLSQEGRRIKLRRQYILTTFEEGRHNLGVASVLYLDKNIADTLHSADSIMLDVATFQIDSTSQSIFDLKRQRAMPFKFQEVKGYAKWGLIILVVLAVVIYLLSRYLEKRGKKITDLFKPTPPLPPHIEAIKALEELRNQKLWQNSKYKEYYSSLTHILRHYIARRYSIAAMEMTSEEIIEAMKGIEDLPSKSSMDLSSLLRDADLVKFAKATPEGEENEEYYHKAYYFVEETKIQEESDPNAEEELFDVKGGQNNKQ